MEADDKVWELDQTAEAARVSALLGVEVVPAGPDPELVEELRSLLEQQEHINSRVRRLTGEVSVKGALRAARKLVEDYDNPPVEEPVEQPKGYYTVDDRDRSVSVRTVRGGLPTLGRNR